MVAVNPKCLSISVPPVSILPQLTKIHFTVINAGSAGKLEICMVLAHRRRSRGAPPPPPPNPTAEVMLFFGQNALDSGNYNWKKTYNNVVGVVNKVSS